MFFNGIDGEIPSHKKNAVEVSLFFTKERRKRKVSNCLSV